MLRFKTNIKKASNSILWFFFAFLLRMPSEKDIIESCRSLNLISTEMVKETSRHQGNLEGPVQILFELQKKLATC